MSVFQSGISLITTRIKVCESFYLVIFLHNLGLHKPSMMVSAKGLIRIILFSLGLYFSFICNAYYKYELNIMKNIDHWYMLSEKLRQVPQSIAV